jgi:hypothetical protein
MPMVEARSTPNAQEFSGASGRPMLLLMQVPYDLRSGPTKEPLE